jgi:hypothetical protein
MEVKGLTRGLVSVLLNLNNEEAGKIIKLLIKEKSNYKKKTSSYVGVYWNSSASKWRASIKLKNKSKHLGYFTNELKASKAYQAELNKVKNG